MIIALASKRFVNRDVSANLNTILSCMKECAVLKADLLCFGECFLQGFDCLDWEHEKDLTHAVSTDSELFARISNAAKQYGTAVAFGYIERDGDFLYSSYAVIDKDGRLIYNFRRVSVGWKETEVSGNPFYKEGDGFSSFTLMGKKISAGLCGDFWDDENIEKINKIDCDLVLWPVFVDDELFGATKWAENISDYARQAKLIHENVLLINSITEHPARASGGCVRFHKGNIVCELPPNTDGLLFVHL